MHVLCIIAFDSLQLSDWLCSILSPLLRKLNYVVQMLKRPPVGTFDLNLLRTVQSCTLCVRHVSNITIKERRAWLRLD